jgi:hypothetical protein
MQSHCSGSMVLCVTCSLAAVRAQSARPRLCWLSMCSHDIEHLVDIFEPAPDPSRAKGQAAQTRGVQSRHRFTVPRRRSPRTSPAAHCTQHPSRAGGACGAKPRGARIQAVARGSHGGVPRASSSRSPRAIRSQTVCGCAHLSRLAHPRQARHQTGSPPGKEYGSHQVAPRTSGLSATQGASVALEDRRSSGCFALARPLPQREPRWWSWTPRGYGYCAISS